MDKQELLDLLHSVKCGEITPEHAVETLNIAPFEDIGYAKVDHHRALRQGVAEVIFGQNKTYEQIAGIADVMRKRGTHDILITRLSEETAARLAPRFPFEYYTTARLGIIDRTTDKLRKGFCRCGFRRYQ